MNSNNQLSRREDRNPRPRGVVNEANIHPCGRGGKQPSSNNHLVGTDGSDSSGSNKANNSCSSSPGDNVENQERAAQTRPTSTAAATPAAGFPLQEVTSSMQNPQATVAAAAAIQQLLQQQLSNSGLPPVSLQQFIQQQLLQNLFQQVLTNQDTSQFGTVAPSHAAASSATLSSGGNPPMHGNMPGSALNVIAAAAAAVSANLALSGPALKNGSLGEVSDGIRAPSFEHEASKDSCPDEDKKLNISQTLTFQREFKSPKSQSKNAFTSERAASKARVANQNQYSTIPSSKNFKIEPCLARKMPLDHNRQTAYFEVSDDTRHGEELLCSHSACRHSGIRFLWCAFCESPAYKRGFSKRHTHASETMPRVVRKQKQEEQECRRNIKKQTEQIELAANSEACRSGNESSNEDEGLQSTESSSDTDDKFGRNQDNHHIKDDRSPSRYKRKREFYTVSFLNTTRHHASGNDAELSSLSSASEHYKDTEHRPHRHKRVKGMDDDEVDDDDTTPSSVSSMEDEGDAQGGISSTWESRVGEAAFAASNSLSHLNEATASELLPLDSTAFEAASNEPLPEDSESVTSSTRAVKLPHTSSPTHAEQNDDNDDDGKADSERSTRDCEDGIDHVYFLESAKAADAEACEQASSSAATKSSQLSSSKFHQAVSSTVTSYNHTGNPISEKCTSINNESGNNGRLRSAEEVRRQNWAKLLGERPPSSDTKSIAQWLLKLLIVSDPAHQSFST